MSLPEPPPTASAPGDGLLTEPQPAPSSRPVVRTRTARAWASLCGGVLAFIVLIVFMAQNTRSTEVTFLWMHGSIPLALALLIAAVGAALLTMVVGIARITQLRRIARRPR